MLRLERKSRDGQVKVLVRDREHLFNRTLWIALALALGYHLLFFTLFHVTPFKILVLDSVLPPISVESDSIVKEAAAVASNEPVIVSFHGIPFPGPSLPALPAHPQYIAMHPSEYVKESNPKDTPFFQLEDSVRLSDMAISLKKVQHPVEIIISGLLAAKTLLSTLPDKQQLAALSRTSNDVRVVYAVRVDGSGKVFWFEAKEQTNNAPIDALAENILRNLTFAADHSAFETDGEIELHFYPESL